MSDRKVRISAAIDWWEGEGGRRCQIIQAQVYIFTEEWFQVGFCLFECTTVQFTLHM